MLEDGGGKGVSPRLAGMRGLEAEVRTCQLCRLAKTRTNAVPGEGYIRTDVMFIGEGPGYHEDRQGRPFVGNAGQFLDELLELAGLSRDRVYIANVVKCRPPNNRDPNPDEIAACAPYLERQIALINPKAIVTLGRYSMTNFFPGERISQIHGQARTVDGRLCVAMYHPAAGLHQASLADVIRDDFRKLPSYLEQLKGAPPPPAAVAEKRLEVAEEARKEVVHEPETSVVLESTEAYSAAPAVEAVLPTAPFDVAPSAEVNSAAITSNGAAKPSMPRKSKKKVESEYKQMSFFDL